MKTESGSHCVEISTPVVDRHWTTDGGLGVPPRIAGTTRAPRRPRWGPGTTVLGLLLCANVTAQAPEITRQPTNQVVAIGGLATFSVVATSTDPPGYQWRHNDIDLEDATQSLLRITNAQPHCAGSYTVVVSNASGSTTSQLANLTVDREWVIYNRGNSGLPY